MKSRVSVFIFRISWCDCNPLLVTCSVSSKPELFQKLNNSLRPHGVHTVHGILQASILEWVAFPFFSGSSQPRDRTHVSRTAGNSLPAEPQSSCKTAIVPSGVMRIESLQNLWASASPSHTLQLLSPSESPVGAPTHSKPGQTEAPAQCHLPLHDTLLCCWETFTLRYIVNPGWWGPWLDWKCSCSCNQSAQPTNPAQVTLTGSATYHHQLHGEHWT